MFTIKDEERIVAQVLSIMSPTIGSDASKANLARCIAQQTIAILAQEEFLEAEWTQHQHSD